MKEITRVITVELTEITTSDDELSDVMSKGDCAALLAHHVKNIFNVDDVNVTKVQDFVQDIKETVEDTSDGCN
jgi:hypothetical protein